MNVNDDNKESGGINNCHDLSNNQYLIIIRSDCININTQYRTISISSVRRQPVRNSARRPDGSVKKNRIRLSVVNLSAIDLNEYKSMRYDETSNRSSIVDRAIYS